MTFQPCTLDERNCDVKREILEQFRRTGKTLNDIPAKFSWKNPLTFT